MTGGYAAIVWVILAVVLFVIEGATVQLICIWFAIGAALTALFAALGAPFWLQLLVFLLASVAVLFIGRPIAKEKFMNKKVPTNADQVVNQTGIVLQEINNMLQAGRVRANGLDWTARSADDHLIIPVDYPVRVLRIDGVKLIVEPMMEQAQEPPEPTQQQINRL